MTATPLADIEAEAIRLVDGLRDRDVTARLLGGLAIAQHRHVELPATLARAYGDIDIVVPPGSASRFREAMEGLGYTANKRFNNMRGDRRMLFYDEPNGRQLDVFVGRFVMCHDLDLRDRLDEHPRTLSPADLLLTKLQVFEINRKDLVDALTLVLTHEVADSAAAGEPADAGEPDVLEVDRLVEVTSVDWGWYTTTTDNLVRIPPLAAELLSPTDAGVVAGRVEKLTGLLAQASKSLKWKTRARVGRRIKWYELPEEVGQTIVTR